MLDALWDLLDQAISNIGWAQYLICIFSCWSYIFSKIL